MAFTRKKFLTILIDGLDPAYLQSSDMPNLRRLMAAGFYRVGKAVIPTVTNVNSASVVTSVFPQEHGVVSNFHYDPRTARSVMMESAEFLERPTLFERARQIGLRSGIVTAKDKIRTLLSRGADVALSGELPSAEFVSAIGPKPDMYSAEVNYWIFRAARRLLKNDGLDVLYLSTTDYMMHTYAPEDERSLEHMNRLDRLLGEIVDDIPNLELGLTADHGMNAKTEGIDIQRVLAAVGIQAEAVPIIKDKHVVHHQNLGGACYVYLKSVAYLAAARDVLRDTPGIEEVYERDTAAGTFRLRADRIGDLFILGARPIVFGSFSTVRQEVSLRSHGSRHEQAVPILLYGREAENGALEYNLDLTRSMDL